MHKQLLKVKNSHAAYAVVMKVCFLCSQVQYPAGQWQVLALLLWVERRPLGWELQQQQWQEQPQRQGLEMQMSLNREKGRGRRHSIILRSKWLRLSVETSWPRGECTSHAVILLDLKGSQTCSEGAGEESRHPCILTVYPHPWSVHPLVVQHWCACACKHQHHAKKIHSKLRLAALFMKGGEKQWCRKDKAA